MPGIESGERQGYATALAGVWSGLGQTLARLDALAAEPAEALSDDAARAAARRLQYALHTAGELVLGIQPPDGSREAHVELARALVEARDATAEVLDEIEAFGPVAALPLVYEWRGALFRVRLARLRLTGRPLRSAAEQLPEQPHERSQAWLAALIALGGAALVVAVSRLGVLPL